MGKTGRGIGLSLALLAVSAVLLGAAVRYESTAAAGVSVTKPRTPLERVASRIAGRNVRIRCGERREWTAVGEDVLGFAVVGGDLSTLAPTVCARLEAMERGERPLDLLMSGAALVTVAHESEHLHGIANEAVAECYGIQRATIVASALGIGREYAAAALRAYWNAYPDRPSAYRSADCHDGGALDLRPATTAWP